MALYHIRKYQERDHKRVLELFSRGISERIPDTFRHVLMLPRTLVLLVGVPLSLLLLFSSWLLAIMSSITLLALLRLLTKYPWDKEMATFLHTDMADIPKTYFSGHDSCFWVAESGGRVVGTVSTLPARNPPLGKKQLQLFHLSVAKQHRGLGIAKALVRTLLQFAQDHGYQEVVIDTTILHHSALGLYQTMGFQKTGQCFPDTIWRVLAIPVIHLTYHVPVRGQGTSDPST